MENLQIKQKLTVDEFIDIKRAVDDFQRLIQHQNLVLAEMLKKSHPYLAQMLKNSITITMYQMDILIKVKDRIEDALLGILEDSEPRGGKNGS